MHLTGPRSEANERFVAFAFAASDMLVETNEAGIIAFASGAFPSRFGRPAEAFVGTSLFDLLAPSDRPTARAAIHAAAGHGRATPALVRLADAARTRRTLAGLALPGTEPPRLCLTFSPLPPSAPALPRATPSSLSRTLATAPSAELMHLVEVHSDTEPARLTDAMSALLDRSFPQAAATELSPGRFSVAGGGLAGMSPGALSNSLRAALEAQGIAARVADQALDLARGDLTDLQVALTLRRAFDAFAKGGLAGLGAAGLGEGLVAFVRTAEQQTTTLRRTIKDRAFTMAYQPVACMQTGKPHHLEALIRPPQHASYAGPQEFVLLAETLNLAAQLDFEVAEAVCEAALDAPAPVAFNVSAQSLACGRFGDRLLHLLRRAPAVKQGRVMLEMTETAVVQDQTQVQAIVDSLRTLSVPFCIDDFGAGAADVQMLRWLSADYVKLDGSYVREDASYERGRSLACGLVEIARRSGAQVIAEWVETEAQRAALQAMGVTLGQGWLFGKPGPLAAEPQGTARRRGAREQWG